MPATAYRSDVGHSFIAKPGNLEVKNSSMSHAHAELRYTLRNIATIFKGES